MKQLADSMYRTLTAEERIIASVEANARDDENEIEKLIQTCPRKNYKSTDRAYSQRMDYLFAIQMAVEADLTQNALDYAVMNFIDIDPKKAVFVQEKARQRIIDIQTAWHGFLEDKGINPETMDQMAMKMRHPYLNMLLDCTLCIPDDEIVKTYRDVFEETYNRNIC